MCSGRERERERVRLPQLMYCTFFSALEMYLAVLYMVYGETHCTLF